MGFARSFFSLIWTLIDIWVNFKYAGSSLKKNGKHVPTPDNSRNRKCFSTYQEKTSLNKYSCSCLKQNEFLKIWNILNNSITLIYRKIWGEQKYKIFLVDHSKLSTYSGPLQQMKYANLLLKLTLYILWDKKINHIFKNAKTNENYLK